MTSRQTHRTWRELWDPWLLPVAATPLLAVAFVSDGRDAMRAPAALMAMLLLLATVGVIAFQRLRSSAVEMVLESAIGTAALAFLAWGLGVSKPVEAGEGRGTAILASVATVVAL